MGRKPTFIRPMIKIFICTLVLTVSVFGSFAAAKAPQLEWWTEEPVTLTINGQSLGFSNLLGVQQVEDRICAIHYMGFMGGETAHLFRGKKLFGRSELIKVRRIRGDMNESPKMELYTGVTGIAQRLYVGGNDEPRLLFLSPAAVPLQMRQSIELSSECAE